MTDVSFYSYIEEILKENDKDFKDILFIVDTQVNAKIDIELWKEKAKKINRCDANSFVLIVGDNWWLEEENNDWCQWSFKTMPIEPKKYDNNIKP